MIARAADFILSPDAILYVGDDYNPTGKLHSVTPHLLPPSPPEVKALAIRLAPRHQKHASGGSNRMT